MCGIAGLVRFDGRPVDERILVSMTRRMTHRGPDSGGTWVQGQGGLGHRRLSIIDIAGGLQPFVSACGQIGLSYNGELYNFKELRHELESFGRTFTTRSDTEVVLQAYQQWGENCVEHFRGMFAFGILDMKRRTLFLARDHLGIKPLYWHCSARTAAFASELDALMSLGEISDELDLRGMDEYLWLQYIPPPRTIYAQVSKLGPGQALSLSLDGVVHGPWEYWRPAFCPDESRSRESWLEAVDTALSESVRVHLTADVPFGVFLSGGLDSGAVLSRMTRELGRPVDAFSIGFDDPDHDEITLARATAKRFNARHHVEIVKEDALALLPQLVRHYGEPFGDSSAIPTFWVSRLARRHVPMVLSGDGGDECFLGYESYLRFMEHLHCRDQTQSPLELGDWLQFVAYFPKVLRRTLWREEHLAKLDMTLPTYQTHFDSAAASAKGVDIARLMDLRTYLPGVILTKVDAVSMANSLEVRTPYTDIRMVELALSIPSRFLAGPGLDGTGKLLLRELLRHELPDEVTKGGKKGFAVPLAKWFDPSTKSGKDVWQRLLSEDSPLFDWLEPRGVRGVWDSGNTWRIWLLLFLDEWLRAKRVGSVD